MGMDFFEDVWTSLGDGCVVDIRMGLNWTIVVIEADGELRCGLASTLRGEHKHTGEPTIPGAGQLIGSSALELAQIAKSDHPTRISMGIAAINALLPRQPDTWTDQNVEHVLTSLGKDQPVALIGHFPFVPRVRQAVKRLDVIDRYPLPGDLPESDAEKVLPEAGVVAITGMTLLNGTLSRLLSLCSPDATVLLLGPTTPLSPLMFNYGIDVLAGSIVENVDSVLDAVSQGANFRQVKKAGVRLVTIEKPSPG